MTSDKRRMVAERLRNNKTTSIDCNSCKIISRALYGYDSAICNRCEQVARDGYAVPDSCEGEGFGRLLADLIDPTCEAIEHGRTDEFHMCKSCSKCSYGWFEDINDKPYSFCPNCGTRMVSGDAD